MPRPAAERAEERDRQHRDRDRGRDGEADAQAQVGVGRAEQQAQHDARHGRAQRELGKVVGGAAGFEAIALRDDTGNSRRDPPPNATIRHPPRRSHEAPVGRARPDRRPGLHRPGRPARSPAARRTPAALARPRHRHPAPGRVAARRHGARDGGGDRGDHLRALARVAHRSDARCGARLGGGQRDPGRLDPADARSPTDTVRVTLPAELRSPPAHTLRVTYEARPRSGLYFFPAGPGAPAGLELRRGRAASAGCPSTTTRTTASRSTCVTVPRPCGRRQRPLAETRDNADGTRTFHWVQEGPIPNYL